VCCGSNQEGQMQTKEEQTRNTSNKGVFSLEAVV